MKKKVRTHDKLYLKENRYENTKESFKYLVKLIQKNIKKKKIYSLLDVGCANGELLYLLNKRFKNFEFTGVDIRKDLLLKAKKKLGKNIEFINKDIFKNCLNRKFDFVICSGVIGINDSPKKFLMNLSKMKKKGGYIYLFHHFNEFNFNVYIKYESINKLNYLESGWNIFSLDYIKNIYKSHKVNFYKFFINKKINPNKKDSIRSWTIRLNNKNYFTNGLNILLNQYWIKIR